MDCRDEKRLNEQAHILVNELVDDVILSLCAETHRAVVCGYYQWMTDSDVSEQEAVDEVGLDVFGQPPLKKAVECDCPNCDRVIVVSRFAPHLEKCMGMGRNSIRLARRRVAYTDRDVGSGEEDDGDEWTSRQRQRKMKSQRFPNGSGSARLVSRTKRPKVLPGALPLFSLSPRQSRSVSGRFCRAVPNKKVGEEPPVGQHCELLSGTQPFLSLPLDKKTGLLSETCGAQREGNSKTCTKHQHTDDDRKAVWMQLIDENTDDVPLSDSQSVSIETNGHGLRVPLETEMDIDVIDGYRDSLEGDSLANLSINNKWEEEPADELTHPPPIPPVRIVPRRASRSKISSRKRSRRR